MHNPKVGSSDGTQNNEKRNLPSWMSSGKDGSKSNGKKQADDGNDPVEALGHLGDGKHSRKATQRTMPFSKLLEDVVFVLSGLVNPERSTLRSQALEMGAEFKPDWTSECTLLVCAFPNTPKFRQVEADCGTIVSKEWISECYKQKKVVEIYQYLMHAGKPWRRNNSLEANQDHGDVRPHKPQKEVDKTPNPKATRSAISKDADASGNVFSPSKVKEWATCDLNETISWLENQEEKPEPDELKKIAAEGIITCLQEAIEGLEKNQDIQHAIEQWMFVPRVVKELVELEGGRSRKSSLTKEELIKLACYCKQIYVTELQTVDDSPVVTKKSRKSAQDEEVKKELVIDDSGFDSDATIEMTEEEIDLACRGYENC